MNTELFIARRFISQKDTRRKVTTPIIRLSTIAIALSVATMIISIAIITGFKSEIRNKVIAFGSHIQIVNFDANNSYETQPIPSDLDFLPAITSIPEVRHIQKFATKPGLIKSKDQVEGVIVKGIGSDFNWSNFKKNIVEGEPFIVSDSIKTDQALISKTIASLLNLKLGDRFGMYFMDDNQKPRARAFTIAGIYETSLQEFDKQFIFADIGHIIRLNNWEENQISGYEILIDNYNNIDQITNLVRNIASYQFMDDGSRIKTQSIMERYPQIFDWLGLLDANVYTLLIIITLIAIINMTAGLLVIILDRTPSIGLLKALGADNELMRKVFLYQAGYLILKGMIAGNVFALVLIGLQKYFRIIKLDTASYFTDHVPVNIELWWWLLLNIAALVLILLTMLLPVIIISRIIPVKTLRYN